MPFAITCFVCSGYVFKDTSNLRTTFAFAKKKKKKKKRKKRKEEGQIAFVFGPNISEKKKKKVVRLDY